MYCLEIGEPKVLLFDGFLYIVKPVCFVKPVHFAIYNRDVVQHTNRRRLSLYLDMIHLVFNMVFL